jgi:TPR repeat protein
MKIKGLGILLLAFFMPPEPASAAEYESGYQALTARDFPAAARLFKAELQNGDSFAALALGHLYMINRGIANFDVGKSVKLILQAAETGNCEAKYLIGTFYYRGYGLMLDEKTALDWFKKSAMCGHSGAQLVVAQIYLERSDTREQAISWLRASARQGHVHALIMLADHFAETGNSTENQVTAMHLYLLSAQRGYPLAAQRIADAYEHGSTAPKDPLAAKRWLEMAAQLTTERREILAATKNNSWSISKRDKSANNSLEASTRQQVSEMATALLAAFPLPTDPFSDIPEGVPTAQDTDTHRILPDNQYAIPQRTFIVTEDSQ